MAVTRNLLPTVLSPEGPKCTSPKPAKIHHFRGAVSSKFSAYHPSLTIFFLKKIRLRPRLQEFVLVLPKPWFGKFIQFKRAKDHMSYALTSDGIVYAWGDNTDGSLALGHDKAVVDKPEPMMRMQGTAVKKLVARDCGGSGGKGKTVIAFVELADPLPQKDSIGGFDRPLGGHGRHEDKDKVVLSDDMEKDIFEGVDLMRQVMDNTQDWWEHILKVRHGSPYNDNPLQVDDLSDKKDWSYCEGPINPLTGSAQ